MTDKAARDVLAADAAFSNQIVARNGSLSWTHAALSGLFDRVRPKDNWKMAIDATVTLGDDHELLGLRAAVEFFTGSVPTLDALGANRYRVRAAGYYAAIGS